MENTYIKELNELTQKTNQYTNQLLHNKKYFHLLKYIIDNTPLLNDDFYTLKTKIFWILNGIKTFPRCKTCGNEIKDKNVFRLNKPEIYNYCSVKCMHNNPEVKSHKKQLLIEKYGVENVFQLEEVKEKSKNTIIKKYGHDHYSKTEEWRNKVKETSFKHYGTEHPRQSDIVKEKYKRTCLEKYGFEYFTQSEIQKEKTTKTCIEKYGKRRYTQTTDFVRRVKNTKLERYGDPNYINVEQIKQTSLKRYGIDNPGATYESISKARRRLFYNGVYFASSPELAYFIWLSDNGIKFQYQPKDKVIQYVDERGKSHKYYPDFYIVDTDELHEIKGENHFQDFDPQKPMIWPGHREKDYIAYAKWQCMKNNNVKILTNKDYMKYIKYVQIKFNCGMNWYKQFKYNKIK